MIQQFKRTLIIGSLSVMLGLGCSVDTSLLEKECAALGVNEIVLTQCTNNDLPFGTLRRVEYILDSKTPARSLNIFLKALADWSALNHGRFVPSVRLATMDQLYTPSMPGYVLVSFGPPPVNGGWDGRAGSTAWYRSMEDDRGVPTSSSIWIYDDPSVISDKLLYLIALHEIGHALGLGHIDPKVSGATVMNEFIISNDNRLLDGPMCTDVHEFCKKWLCSANCEPPPPELEPPTFNLDTPNQTFTSEEPKVDIMPDTDHEIVIVDYLKIEKK